MASFKLQAQLRHAALRFPQAIDAASTLLLLANVQQHLHVLARPVECESSSDLAAQACRALTRSSHVRP